MMLFNILLNQFNKLISLKKGFVLQFAKNRMAMLESVCKVTLLLFKDLDLVKLFSAFS